MGLTLEQAGGWTAMFRKLTAGEDLSADEAAAAMTEMLSGDATSAQIGAFLIALRAKGETAEEMAGLYRAAWRAADTVPLPDDVRESLVDTCGTGGNQMRRDAAFHVGTLSAFVVAGAGVRVCKHGNRKASSSSGSFDLLEALGVAVELGPQGVARCVLEAGIGVCFARRYHPAFRHTAPVRADLGVPTVFNLLGPLLNPAHAGRRVLGVSDETKAERVLAVLKQSGVRRAMVVHGHDGLDELTTTTSSTVHELVEDGSVRRYDIDPETVGLPTAEPEAIRGGDTARNLDLARRVLAGERGAHRDLVVLNAAAGLVVGGVVDDLAAGVPVAEAVLDDGRAQGALDRLVEVSQAAAAG